MGRPRVLLFEEAVGMSKFELGGKGYGLVEMTKIGLPVPPGINIPTYVCREYYETERLPDGLLDEVREKIKVIEESVGRRFGSRERPLLFSVRSGAPYSMPGMMDTILNLGLNDEIVKGLAEETGDERFAYDSYRRLIQMFGKIVLGVKDEKFDEIIEKHKKRLGVKQDVEIPAEEWKKIIEEFKELIKLETGREFPQDPWEQLKMAIEAVFRSWDNPRAKVYRKTYNIPDDLYTAVNVQMMVFGNIGFDSGTGVGFTRNPSTGEKKLYGEYLLNAQGEDVVAGIRTPKPIDELKNDLPQVYEELLRVSETLERHFKDMQDFEFTIQEGKLYMLQTRTGKRTAQAAVKMAVDMVNEGLITKEEALSRIDPNDLNQLLHRRIDPNAKVKPIAKGLNASPGAATGKVVFTADEAAELGGKGEKVILVRPETKPEDIHGMIAAQGILTSRGGMTCIAGDVKILTHLGFMKVEEAYRALERGIPLLILAYDHREGKVKWRRIIAAGRRKAKAIEISVSQTGRSRMSTLRITPDHKMYTFKDRKLTKEELQGILSKDGYVCVIDKIPSDGPNNAVDLAYVAGAIFTDGYINLKPVKGSVTFTQNPNRREFIEAVRGAFLKVFGRPFNVERLKRTRCVIRGRTVAGQALDLICTSREPAVQLSTIRNGLVRWVISLDEPSTLSFIAGVVDGDGTLYNNRINIFTSDESLLQAVVVACLKLGIVPQVTSNRSIYNVQIVERIEDILAYTRRVNGRGRKRIHGTKLFSARSILSDIADKVNYNGRIKTYIKRNLLISSSKLREYVLPYCDEKTRKELSKIISSDLRMFRVKKVRSLDETYVYNFEIEAVDELDKNFIVFTDSYVPVLVSNSHAAVVARGMGKPAIVGAEMIQIDLEREFFKVDGVQVNKFDIITIDGTTGQVYLGEVPTIEPELGGELKTLLSWADEIRRLGVRANAETPEAAAKAREFGAEGIGLARTERMFNAPDRLPIVYELIFAENEEERWGALRKLLPMLRTDFKQIFEAMAGYPVTVRLLDLPLHEFLPRIEELIEEVTELRIKVRRRMRGYKKAKKLLAEKERVLKKALQLAEHNPMIGHRGCRLGIRYPEIYRIQTRAILEAALELKREGKEVHPEIMIPLVSEANELKILRKVVEEEAEKVFEEQGDRIEYHVGTMIETPRAALTAAEIAKVADFFSFGTNDLTQTTFAFSRDDAEAKFMAEYLEKKILPRNPFEVLDERGVGRLVEMATREGKQANPNLVVGICGEHGGEPDSIHFFDRAGLDYVSCSSYRVPIARLAAAQAQLKKLEVKATV